MQLQFNYFYILFGFLNPNQNPILGIIQNIGFTKYSLILFSKELLLVNIIIASLHTRQFS